jgi:ABC-type Fe3+/spermidine/putrescine transport system ATPase subunit
MRTEVRRICNETKITTVYVTHDQEEALSIADRMALLRDGRLLQIGTPQDIYARPATRFTADFLGRANFIPATATGESDGVLTLQGPAGTLVSKVFPEGIKGGASVTCCVRPESLRIDDGATAVNRLRVRHVMTHYLGHLAEHVFEAPDGLKLSVEELKPRPRRWSATSPVELTFDPADVVVLWE